MKTILLMVLLSAWAPVHAMTPGACQADADRLCPGAAPKEITPCLQKNAEQLSTACKVNLAEARERIRETRDVCEPDVKKFCAGVEKGKGRILKCLKAHESEVSKACLEKISETKHNILPNAPTDHTLIK